MTVIELIQELQRLDRPDLDVFIPCPHCCGQRGVDFDLLDAEYVVQMERDGGQVGLPGDPRQYCLGDRRSDSRLRVRKAATGHAPAIAAGLALQYVRTLALTDTERISVEARGGHIVGSRFRCLRNPELAIIEATDGQATHYVMVETPFRASPQDIALVQRNVELITELTGCIYRAVMACVVVDSSAEADTASGDVNRHFIERGELEAE